MDYKEEIRKEIEFCECLLTENQMEAKESLDDWFEGYHRGQIIALKGEIRRLKRLIGEDDF